MCFSILKKKIKLKLKKKRIIGSVYKYKR